MKFYGDAPYASMEMKYDPLQHELLVKTLKEQNITVAIETGTYLGLGSTTNLAKAFIEAQIVNPKVFTMEANSESYYKAKDNLKLYSFIEPLFGCSLTMEHINKIADDEALIHPENYPDVYLDFRDNQDGRQGYIAESIGAGLDNNNKDWKGFNLLPDLLNMYKHYNPLILLDSAGGLGKLEFEATMEIMKDNDFVMLLDDVEHVKHFRSLEYIKQSSNFELVATQNGWALAIYKA
ncbi:MAG: hypothetical protein KGH75_01470 [Rhodospirillales bacterium]|nr:hypothetical protein [Rhodospirillales bacterium]